MVEIRITFDEQTGQLHVHAPQNTIQTYGLLEMAKDVVRLQMAQRQKVQPPQPSDVALLMGRR